MMDAFPRCRKTSKRLSKRTWHVATLLLCLFGLLPHDMTLAADDCGAKNVTLPFTTPLKRGNGTKPLERKDLYPLCNNNRPRHQGYLMDSEMIPENCLEDELPQDMSKSIIDYQIEELEDKSTQMSLSIGPLQERDKFYPAKNCTVVVRVMWDSGPACLTCKYFVGFVIESDPNAVFVTTIPPTTSANSSTNSTVAGGSVVNPSPSKDSGEALDNGKASNGTPASGSADGGSSNTTTIVAIIAAGCVLIAAIAFAAVYVRSRRKREQPEGFDGPHKYNGYNPDYYPPNQQTHYDSNAYAGSGSFAEHETPTVNHPHEAVFATVEAVPIDEDDWDNNQQGGHGNNINGNLTGHGRNNYEVTAELPDFSSSDNYEAPVSTFVGATPIRTPAIPSHDTGSGGVAGKNAAAKRGLRGEKVSPPPQIQVTSASAAPGSHASYPEAEPITARTTRPLVSARNPANDPAKAKSKAALARYVNGEEEEAQDSERQVSL